MRPQAFTAATLAEAMQLVRDALGDDAIIVATEQDQAGIRILATAEPPAPPAVPAKPLSANRPSSGPLGGTAYRIPDPAPAPPPPPPAAESPAAFQKAPLAGNAYRVAEPEPPAPPPTPAPGLPKSYVEPALRTALAFHGLPDVLIGLLLDGPTGPTLAASLAQRLQSVFRFAGLLPQADRPLLLAGPPGVGKTLAAAKLAAQAVLAGKPARLITTDTISAGSVEQLAAFALPLRLDLETADGPDSLAALFAQPSQAGVLTIIDTAGVNPLDDSELAGLSEQIAAANADPVLVLGAGIDARECAETADAFASIGCERLLITRIDLARRLGGVLAAAAGYALTEFGSSPLVAQGFQPANPDSLALLLLAQTRIGARP